MDGFRVRLGALADARSADPALRHFIQGVDDLADELARHMRADDGALFPLFGWSAQAVAPAMYNP